MTVRDVEGLLRLFTYLMLAYPISIILTNVLTSRYNRRWFMDHIELFAPKKWRVRFEWRDRKIERLQEQVREKDDTIQWFRANADQQQRILNQ